MKSSLTALEWGWRVERSSKNKKRERACGHRQQTGGSRGGGVGGVEEGMGG